MGNRYIFIFTIYLFTQILSLAFLIMSLEKRLCLFLMDSCLLIDSFLGSAEDCIKLITSFSEEGWESNISTGMSENLVDSAK